MPCTQFVLALGGRVPCSCYGGEERNRRQGREYRRPHRGRQWAISRLEAGSDVAFLAQIGEPASARSLRPAWQEEIGCREGFTRRAPDRDGPLAASCEALHDATRARRPPAVDAHEYCRRRAFSGPARMIQIEKHVASLLLSAAFVAVLGGCSTLEKHTPAWARRVRKPAPRSPMSGRRGACCLVRHSSHRWPPPSGPFRRNWKHGEE